MGLLRASRTFDETRHVEFQCYARTRVRGAILDSLRENDWAPRSLRHKAREISDAYQRLSVSLGRCPNDVELAEKLGLSLPQLQVLARDLDGLKIFSLDETDATSFGTPVCDRIAGPNDDIPYNRCLRAEIETLLGNAIARMAESARRVLVHYYYDGMTMKEVGSMLGVGESRVSQIHKVAIQKLRQDLQQAIESLPDDEGQYTPPGEAPATEAGDYRSHLRNDINECYGK